MRYKTPIHYTLMIYRYWEGFSPLDIYSNLVLRPYFFEKIRILGKLDFERFLEMKYKTNDYWRGLLI